MQGEAVQQLLHGRNGTRRTLWYCGRISLLHLAPRSHAAGVEAHLGSCMWGVDRNGAAGATGGALLLPHAALAAQGHAAAHNTLTYIEAFLQSQLPAFVQTSGLAVPGLGWWSRG